VSGLTGGIDCCAVSGVLAAAMLGSVMAGAPGIVAAAVLFVLTPIQGPTPF